MEKNIATLDSNKQNKTASWALLIGIILIGSNLRAPLTSVGSLMSFIREDLGLSNTLAGTITTLPLLAFALLSPFAPKIANRIGMEWTIFFSLILLTAGLVIRSFFGVTLLFVGTVLIGLAIAIGNVLLPGFIKMNFPLKIGLMTGIYAVFMNLFGALASGLSVPISSISGIGWKGSLAFWGILSIAALLVWIPQLRKQTDSPKAVDTKPQEKHSIWKSPLAWYITIFMGMQSLVFYTLITWLPGILQTHGYGASAAGWMLSLMQFSLIPITFIVPIIAEKMSNQKLLSGITGGLFIFGVLGLILGNSVLIPVAVISLGIGAGAAFSLSMMFFSLRTTSGQQASEMSGMAQSFGYLMAASGPVLFGALHDYNNSWILPLVVLGVVGGIIFICGIQAGKNRTISDISEQKNRQPVDIG
ncbi:CP family cyanate transporter-like MFS transporter [Virgibacillus halotolerans]|uniref:CynX/NimT family MFS transporter n=1 Tax=Virgibacillus halotolerans TaxID=1071053 RepID=UPI001EF88EDE|nr:MFS transporter [Virgibacillus halotolerans]MBM7598870.1 CP family cyanate transporter-like MFS transporter [Virgibacillus halotolerans]